MNASNLVQKLWNYCNVLRDDGMSYGDYVEQLTYLLFLKMADERSRPPHNQASIVPASYAWPTLLKYDGDELFDHYRHALEALGNEKGIHQGDYPAARALLEEGLAINRELGNRSEIGLLLSNLGFVALNQSDYPAARALLEESLAIRRELGGRSGIPSSLEGLAALVASQRDSLRAARIWGGAERLRAEIGTPLPTNERSGYDRRVAAARSASGDDAAFDSAWQEGRGLTLDQAIDLALARPGEGG